MRQKIVAIIPARGGSKRVKNKNIKSFNGVPLILWTLVEAFKTFEIDDIFVSTESKKIKSIVEFFGFSSIDRPEEIADEFSSSDLVLLHSLKELGEEKYDFLAFIQCTNPFDTYLTYSSVLSYLLKNKKFSNSFASSIFKGWLWEEKKNSSIGYNHEKTIRKRSQDIDWNLQLERGSIVGIKISDFLISKNRFSGLTKAILSSNKFSLDIDTESDFFIAEQIFKARRKLNKFVKPKIIFTDFDGVLSDNKVTSDTNGIENVTTSKSDSIIIKNLKEQIDVVVISSETSGTTKKRCEKIGLKCFDAIHNKKQKIKDIIIEKGYNWEDTVYIGNDLNDIVPIMLSGYSFAPSDSDPLILDLVNEVLPVKGGEGVLRYIFNKYFNFINP